MALECGARCSLAGIIESSQFHRHCNREVRKSSAGGRIRALRVAKNGHSSAAIRVAAHATFHWDSEPKNRPLPRMCRVQAVLFDVDGTLVDSDPLHYLAFRDMLAEINYNGGTPITNEFYCGSISGKHNLEVGKILFPDWDQARRDEFLKEKEARFRTLAEKHLDAVAGLHRLTDWIKKKGFHRAAVTNAPRASAEQMIAAVGLTDFFENVVIGSECERAKPFPDPYLKGLEHFGVSPQNAFAFEDSAAGLSAAVAAGLPVVGVTTGHPGPALIAAGAAFLIKDYNDPALWKRLEK